MNYANLSDFEINKLVASAQSLLINDKQCASLKVKSSSVLVNDIVSSFEFNPCNNPSDAWAIIVDNAICINAMAGGDFTLWYANDKFHSDPDAAVYDENPLRAAMIVFLMMQENSK